MGRFVSITERGTDPSFLLPKGRKYQKSLLISSYTGLQLYLLPFEL